MYHWKKKVLLQLSLFFVVVVEVKLFNCSIFFILSDLLIRKENNTMYLQVVINIITIKVHWQ